MAPCPQRRFHKVLVGAGRVEARAGGLGVLQFVRVHQQGREKRPLAADKGLHRVHPAEVARHQKDAEAAVGHGEAGAQGGGLHKAAAELRHGELQQRGHGLHFVGLDKDTAAAGAAVAALPALEHLGVRVGAHKFFKGGWPVDSRTLRHRGESSSTSLRLPTAASMGMCT